MASIALGAAGAFVGGLLGGPIGANIGWMLGAAIGNSLNPQQIEGPRLSDLKLQASGYGRPIPIVYGTKRIAGNVIWKTDLTEHSQTTGGKGGPEVTSYTYSASFAVQICEGPIADIKKVWADGRVVLDRTPGAEPTVFPFTTYLGTETQDADPTMQGILGVDNVPAYRGTAYVVFDDIDLAAFGQRIPNLEFEVATVAHTDAAMNRVKFDDAGPVTWNYYAGATPTGDGMPQVIAWPLSGDEKIRVIRAGTSEVEEYNADDLTYSGQVARSIDDVYPVPYAEWVDGVGYIYYNAVGQVLVAGNPTSVYVQTSYPVGSPILPPVVGSAISGVPDGEYVLGATLTQDRTALFLYTAPSSGAACDKWYLIEDGAVVDSGTISPTIIAATSFAFGSSSGNRYAGSPSFYYASSMAENNRRYIWVPYGAASASMSVYTIDDSGNLAYNSTVGNGAVYNGLSYCATSVYVLADGYAGIVLGDSLQVWSRYPQGEGLTVPLADILSDLSVRAGLDVSEIDVTGIDDYPEVSGYVVGSQMAARSAIEPLQQCYFFDSVESDGKVKFVSRGGASLATIPDDDLAAYISGDPPPMLTTTRQQEVELPRVVDLVYSNKDADYQEGAQHAIRQGTLSQTSIALQVPLVFDDYEAKQITDRILYAAWSERERFNFSTSRRYAKYEPTDTLTVRGRAIRIVDKTESPNGLIEWKGVAAIAPSTFVQGAVPGTGSGFVPQTPPSIQGTNVELLDLPLITDNDAPAGFYVAMNGAIDTNWGGATLYKSSDSGVTYEAVATSRFADRIGVALTTLGDWTGPNQFDETNTVSVQLTAGSADLSSTTELGVLNGGNMCVIGSEVLQYKTATLTATRTYTLSGLLRGRRGTDWAQSTHGSSELFVALPTTLNLVGDEGEISLPRLYKAVSGGNSISGTPSESFTNTGIALRPFSPVEIGGGRDASGNLTITWVRRSRYRGDGMLDVEPPIGEESEFYLVTIYSSNTYTTVKRTLGVDAATTASYTAAWQVEDFGSTQSVVYLGVQMRGHSFSKERRAIL